MKRYHKKIYFPRKHHRGLFELCNSMKSMPWKYSKHALDNIKNRSLFVEDVLKFIKDLSLSHTHIFEYYTEKDIITKMCFRYTYDKETDIIIVVSNEKRLVTVYYNAKDDEHYTLNKTIYENEGDTITFVGSEAYIESRVIEKYCVGYSSVSEAPKER